MKRLIPAALGLAARFAALAAAPSVCRAEAGPESYEADLARLASFPHRLCGSAEAAQASGYIETRLREAGVRELYTVRMPVACLRARRCEMQVGGVTIPISPVRPNLTVPPVTPPEGISGPLLYVGRGEIGDYGDAAPGGAIVALDYDSFDNWHRAFAMGARAVLFVGDGRAAATRPLHTPLPVNLLRFYVDRGDLGGMDLAGCRSNVTLHSEVTWEKAWATNIVAAVRGSDPTLGGTSPGPESLVLSAGYDTFGEVPHRSPGARRAANVAALLDAARTFAAEPAARHLIFMFPAGRSAGHQGAREVYDALAMEAETHAGLIREHAEESAHWSRILRLLESRGLRFDRREPGAQETFALLRDLAQFRRDDVTGDMQALRHSKAPGGDSHPLEKESELAAAGANWDEIRRAIHEQRVAEMLEKAGTEPVPGGGSIAAMLDVLLGDARGRAADGLRETEERRQADAQRETLQRGIFGRADGADMIRRGRAIVLHASFDFSDVGPAWGPVAGSDNDSLFGRQPLATDDNPGLYTRVHAAFREAAGDCAAFPLVSGEALRDPLYGSAFMSGLTASEGWAAGCRGIYNVALATGYDLRERDGHPSDSLANLDGARILAQSREAVRLLRRLAGSPALSLPMVFSQPAFSKYPGWRGGRPWGDMATLQVVGGLAEARPAAGALVAVWPASAQGGSASWSNLKQSGALADFSPFPLEWADSSGRFRFVGIQNFRDGEYMTAGALFDGRGGLRALSSLEGIRQKPSAAGRTSLMTAVGGGFAHMPVHRLMDGTLRLVKGSTDGAFRPHEVVYGALEPFVFAYINTRNVGGTLKFFQPMGPVILNISPEGGPTGRGVPPGSLASAPRASAFACRDLWTLNESRLSAMRLRGVARADLERLHAAALAANAGVEQGRDSPAEAESVMQGSASISHRIHEPLLGSLNDLVHAIVILLLLSIPFAFAMERLVIGATSVYGRIAGFALIFGVTFALLYATHPGFALSSTPMIIFLAFAVLLLSSAVIAIVLRKFDAELKAMQGRSATIHAVETSRIGTMLAAAGMGISTMKRRRTRTLLSAVTVVTLTFAVLCFASLTRELGVRVAYEGPVADGMPAGLLAHRMDYTALPSGAQDLMHPEAGDGGLLAVQWWRTRQAEGDPPLTAVNPASGAAVALDAALGLHPDEPARWPALGECLDGGEHAEWLRRNGVYLPAAVADLLGLARGDAFLLEGKRVVFAGLLRSAGLQRLRNLDNRPVLPVDFREAGLGAVAAAADDPSAGALARADSDRNFKRLGVEQVAVVSDRLARSLGGNPHVANLYPGGQTDLSARARKLAALLSMPVWSAGANGVDRSLLTVLTGVSGGLALGVPLVLGGLIIFGSLLGSITDRQKEIYTFSALGLSPGHVGLLFFAEAAVYAVVGGMGGQLLAQGVGWAASRLAARGVIEPVSINFSSTHSLFAMGAVMAVVLVSAVYPAIRASRSANPGLARSWRMPSPAGDRLAMTFPFTVSANDIAGVIAFLAEHFRSHDDAGLGAFAASEVIVCRGASGRVELRARLALAPFDLGVTESFVLGSVPSEIEGVDEVRIGIERISGARGDWIRGNRVFIRGLRVQFLAWRTLAPATMEQYRAETLAALGEDGADCRMTTEPAAGGAEG